MLPGPYLDGENIYALMDTYKVTVSTGRLHLCRLLQELSGRITILEMPFSVSNSCS